MTEIGDRVFAISFADELTVYLFGIGTYNGRDTPPAFAELGLRNPRIDLDDGGTVWGYQCWWGPIEEWERTVAGRKVVDVPLPADVG